MKADTLRQIYRKDVLKLSEFEILMEIEDILKIKAKKPPKWKGWITDNPGDYVKDGKIDVSKLIALYDKGPKVFEYIITLSFTSICNRPKDLFSLIREQKSGNRVLEYGSGVSTHGIACAARGCEVHAFDISSTMIKYSKSRYVKRGLSASFHLAEDTLPKDYFDMIVCADVVEHVPDPLLLLNTLTDCLKTGGKIHFHVSKMKSWQKGHLPQAINQWFKICVPILNGRFEKVSSHNYILRNRI